jgi:site-specific recombinase XerD
MLGHKNITQTQRYAKVLAESVRDDFNMVENKLREQRLMRKVGED